MNAGALRERVRFERKAGATGVYDDGDGGGNGWTELMTVAADISPAPDGRGGGEKVIGERRLSLNMYSIRVRQSAAVLAITAADRIVDARDGRVFNIRQMDNPDKRDKFILITAETGRQDGGS